MQDVVVNQSSVELVPLIPRELLFGNPERANPKLSPDRKYLTYIAPDSNNVLQIWLRTVGQQDDRMLTADKKRGIRVYFWTYDGKQLIYLQDSDGDENWHLYAVNIQSLAVRDLTPFAGVQAQLVALDPNFPELALIGLNQIDRRKHDVYCLNLKTASIEFNTENPGNVVGWEADAQFQVRSATAATPDGGWDLLVRDRDQPWQTVRHWGPEDQGSAVSFSADGKTLYILGSHDANAGRLLALDLATAQETVVAEDSQYDVGGIFIHPIKRNIQAVSFYKEKSEWQVLDPSIAADFATLAQLRRGEFSIISRDLADTTWLVAYAIDDGPTYYYTYDRHPKTSTLLFSNQPKLESLPLAPMQPVSFQAQDGVTLHGYLTTPVGVPSRNLPTVLLVHGGPWARDTWGYSQLCSGWPTGATRCYKSTSGVRRVTAKPS